MTADASLKQLAMIRGDDHDRVVPEVQLTQQLEQLPEVLIGPADLPVVLRHQVVELRLVELSGQSGKGVAARAVVGVDDG